MPNTIHAIVCNYCNRDEEACRTCPQCLGRMVTWSDGKPFTRCPETNQGRDRARDGIACGRGSTCNGCLRTGDQIPTQEDIDRTRRLGW